jgi:hypothetical protein
MRLFFFWYGDNTMSDKLQFVAALPKWSLAEYTTN